MAQSWYLMQSPYDQLSGYESEAIDDFGQEGFAEVLDSEMASDILLCNYDLSDCEEKRAVVLNNVQDTKLKTLSKMMLVPIGTCAAGMYVKYDNRYWLIVGVVDNNKVYEKAILALCNYLITWQDDTGKVIQRWANIVNASQYNNGEYMVKYYTVRSDQLLVSISDDKDSLMLDSSTRFIVDKRCKIYAQNMGSNVTVDTSNPVLTYHITRINNTIYDYQDSGHIELMLDQDEQHEGDGYYVIDGTGYWLCESKHESHSGGGQTHVSVAEIVADSYELLNGVEPNVFLAKFYDEHGSEVQTEFTWSLDCSFEDDLEISYQDNAIYIYVDNKDLINKSFNLMLSAEGYDTVSAQITIRAFI